MPGSNIENQAYPAADTAQAAAAVSSPNWGSFIGTVVVFILILLVAYWVIRRLNNGAGKGMMSPWMRVLDRHSLGGKQMLYLVEIAGKLQVLGGTEQQLVKIADIDDPQTAAEILEEIASRPVARVDGLLVKLTKRLTGPKTPKSGFSSELEKLLEEVDQ